MDRENVFENLKYAFSWSRRLESPRVNITFANERRLSSDTSFKFYPKTQTLWNYSTQTQWLSASHSLLCSLSASTLLHKTWSKLTKRNLAAKKTTRSAARKKTKSAARRKIRSLARRVAWTTAKRNATKRRVAAANKVVATKRAATRSKLAPF